MSIPGLTIIGERINPGFASTRALLEKQDLPGLQALAVSQKTKGAHYLTINVGELAQQDTKFLADLIRAVQEVCDLPLSFDYPNRAVQEVCLRTFDPTKAGGRRPIVNSVTELRWDMLEVLKIQPARVVLMASERMENNQAVANLNGREIADTARRMVDRVLNEGTGLTKDDLLIDLSLGPIASDTDGVVRRGVEAIQLINRDPEMRGVHRMVGLSNLGIMLPKLALDGGPLPTRIESAFLTLTMPHGLDTILGTPGRSYQLLPEDDFVFRGFCEVLKAEGFDALEKVQHLYQSNGQ